MKSYTEQLQEDLLSELADLDNQYNPQNLVDRRLGIIAAAIDQVKEKLKTYVFESAEEEAYYFKMVLPPTLALYIYYTDKLEWDRVNRQGTPENLYRFTDRIYSQAENFRKENQSFCDYYRDEKTALDCFYFLRDSAANREANYQIRRIIDPLSPPIHSEMIAIWIAYSRLEQEMKSGISENNKGSNNLTFENGKHRWTGRQIDFVELVYGLTEAGCINYGKTSLSDNFLYFGKVFQFDPGNTTRIFQDILRRRGE